jgi:putative flippase GtrA
MWSVNWSITKLRALMNSITQPIVFGLVGLLNTLIHYGIYLLLFKTFGVYYLVSSGVGYCCGLINSYVLTRKLTFKIDGRQNLREFSRFIAVNIFSLSVNLTVLKMFVEILQQPPEISQFYAIFISMTTNFVGNKLWTFKAQ